MSSAGLLRRLPWLISFFLGDERPQPERSMDLSNATITQLLIPVDEFERGVSFYRDTLGIRLLFSAPPQMAFFQCGAVRLLIGVMPAGQKAQGGSAIYFSVTHIEEVYASLREKGVQFKAPPHVANRSAQSETWLAEFIDPDGNQLALLSEKRIA
jgi:methylmalonyl-CoA/ethylmalonyl-CoA epimerase